MTLDYSRNPEILENVKKKLRPYQIKAVAKACRSHRCLFDMYMGLGKTVCALTALFAHRPKKVLIICGAAALGTWIREVKKWYPEYAIEEEFVVIKGQGGPVKRRKLWNKDVTFYICTKETFNLDQEVALQWQFDAYIIDEAHKIPKHTTKTFKKLEKGLRDIPLKLMLTGTWIKRDASRGWRQLHMLHRKAFPSYWKFMNRYCITVNNGWGTQVVGPKNIEEFYHQINPYVYRNHEIAGNIPESVRKLMWVNMTTEQDKFYHELSDNMFTMLENGELIISTVSLATFTKHRQLLNCPKIHSESLGIGAAFENVLQTLKDFEDDPEEQHAVIFSPFKQSLPYFERELKARGYPTWSFIGGTRGDVVEQRAEEFRSHKGKKSIALCTIDFAESFHLGTALRSHFIGIHHDGDPMKQAEARLARADSDLDKTIVHRYWLYNDTMDEDRFAVLEGRASHVRKLFHHVDNIKEVLRIG